MMHFLMIPPDLNWHINIGPLSTDEVIRYQTKTSFSALAIDIGLALLVIFLTTWFIIVYTNRFFNWLSLKNTGTGKQTA